MLQQFQEMPNSSNFILIVSFIALVEVRDHHALTLKALTRTDPPACYQYTMNLYSGKGNNRPHFYHTPVSRRVLARRYANKPSKPFEGVRCRLTRLDSCCPTKLQGFLLNVVHIVILWFGQPSLSPEGTRRQTSQPNFPPPIHARGPRSSSAHGARADLFINA